MAAATGSGSDAGSTLAGSVSTAETAAVSALVGSA